MNLKDSGGSRSTETCISFLSMQSLVSDLRYSVLASSTLDCYNFHIHTEWVLRLNVLSIGRSQKFLTCPWISPWGWINFKKIHYYQSALSIWIVSINLQVLTLSSVIILLFCHATWNLWSVSSMIPLCARVKWCHSERILSTIYLRDEAKLQLKVAPGVFCLS